MTRDLSNTIFNTSCYAVTVNDSTTTGNTITLNKSVPDGCIKVRSSELEHLPWDNPDNIISADVEKVFSRIKCNTLVILFLIGVPANFINMAVFHKQGLQDRVNLCLFALSLADELFLIIAGIYHVEQVYLQFTTKESYTAVMIFIANNNLVGIFGVQWVSQILSAVIACERCLCICSPLKFQTLLQTRTMTIIIIVVYLLVTGIYFLVSFRYRVGCLYDPVTAVVFNGAIIGELYKTHQNFIDYLDSFVYGAGIPGVVIIVVITSTMMTTVKLRQVITWRAGTSSSVSAREVALTKMLIGNSLLFIACITPVGLFRVVCIIFPSMNVGKRHQNYYLSGVWILQTVSYINSTFNFFVYYTMGSRYRETFWALFGRQRKRERGDPVPVKTLSET